MFAARLCRTFVPRRSLQVTHAIRTCAETPRDDLPAKQKKGRDKGQQRYSVENQSAAELRFSDYERNIRYKGKLFRQSGGPRVARSQRKEIEVAQPDVLKELKVRAQFAEKILAHVTGSDVKVNLRLRRLPDTHPEPLKPKTLGVIFRARLKEPRS